MTRMTTRQETLRAEVEDTLARLARAERVLQGHVRLRLRQGLARGGAVEVLAPALDDVEEVAQQLDQAQQLMAHIWRAGNAAHWLARRGEKEAVAK